LTLIVITIIFTNDTISSPASTAISNKYSNRPAAVLYCGGSKEDMKRKQMTLKGFPQEIEPDAYMLMLMIME
jgi:hypothetical protein